VQSQAPPPPHQPLPPSLPPSVLGLHYSLSAQVLQSSLTVSVQGYNHKLPLLTQTILEALSNYKGEEEDDALFARLQDRLVKDYANDLLSQPYQVRRKGGREGGRERGREGGRGFANCKGEEEDDALFARLQDRLVKDHANDLLSQPYKVGRKGGREGEGSYL